jgi:hypothetical protein
MHDMNDYAARVICKQLKYEDGHVVRKGSSDKICENLEG